MVNELMATAAKAYEAIIHIPGTTLRERWAQALLEQLEADMTPDQRMMRDAIVFAVATRQMGGWYTRRITQ